MNWLIGRSDSHAECEIYSRRHYGRVTISSTSGDLDVDKMAKVIRRMLNRQKKFPALDLAVRFKRFKTPTIP